MDFLKIIKDATKSVPFVKYALGVAGIGAVIALIKSFGIDYRVGVWGTIMVLVLMTILFLLAKTSQDKTILFKKPAMFLLWSIVILFIIVVALLITSVFFKLPIDLENWINTNPQGVDLSVNNKSNLKSEISLKGIVMVDGKAKEQVLVKFLDVEKTTRTNYFGLYYIPINFKDTLSVYKVEFVLPFDNIDTLILINGNNEQTIYLNSKKILTKQSTLKTFAIKPNELGNLIKVLENNGLKKSLAENATYNVEFSFEGQIDTLGNNLYRYNGGTVTFKINNENIKRLEKLKINSTFNGGNSYNYVFTSINNQIISLVENNTNYVYKKLQESLK